MNKERHICVRRRGGEAAGPNGLVSDRTRSNLFQCLGAAHDVHQFLGDRGLPGLVVIQRHLLDELAGVSRRTVHGGHTGTMFCGSRLQEDAIAWT